MRLRNIHQIESTSCCNLKCRYCPHHELRREKMHMSWETFIRTMEWVLYFRERNGKQIEIALTGVGEPFLNPRLPDMIEYCRKNCPESDITVSTNGIPVTEELADKIKEYEPKVFVSLHVPEKAVKAIEILAARGIFEMSNDKFNTLSNNWAGQVDWPVGAEHGVCGYIGGGSGVVLSDGRIVRCCMDAHGLGVIGNVYEAPREDLMVNPFFLCETCHMVVPEHEMGIGCVTGEISV